MKQNATGGRGFVKRGTRRGMSAVEVIAILGLMFPFVMAFYFLGREACVRLYYVIDALVSWPYL